MQRNRILGMACGYYLSRFDKDAYTALGYGNQTATHEAIGRALGLPALSVRNWRDEFDPAHDNSRRGWHKRDMRASRLRMIEVLSPLSQDELHALLEDAIQSQTSPGARQLLRLVGDVDDA